MFYVHTVALQVLEYINCRENVIQGFFRAPGVCCSAYSGGPEKPPGHIFPPARDPIETGYRRDRIPGGREVLAKQYGGYGDSTGTGESQFPTYLRGRSTDFLRKIDRIGDL